MGMLAWFVDGYVDQGVLSPDWLLVLFIVSVLALAWAIFTLFSYHRSSINATFVGIVDILFVGAFIAGVYFLRWIRNRDCTDVVRDGSYTGNFGDLGSVMVADYDFTHDKGCAMLKASWAFGIMNIFFFFFSGCLALMHGNRHDDRYYHKSRHHRHRSGSRHSSRRSSRHSHRRVYV